MPLDAALGPARVLAIKNGLRVTADELKQFQIKRGERILFKTRNSSLWKAGGFKKDFVFVSEEAAVYLASAGVRVVGMDYFSVGGYKENGAKVHKILLGAGIWLIEGLNFSGVKPGLYDLICLPLKMFNADGAPARAIIRRRRP